MIAPVTPEAAAAASLLGPEPDGIPVPPGAGPALQRTLFELSRPGRGGGKVAHPPKDALDRIPGRRASRGAAGAAGGRRARRWRATTSTLPGSITRSTRASTRWARAR